MKSSIEIEMLRDKAWNASCSEDSWPAQREFAETVYNTLCWVLGENDGFEEDVE